MNIFSVIDCGTNTFNLSVVFRNKNGFTIYHEKKPVKIGFNLNSTRLISDDAILRATDAMLHFKDISTKFKSEKIIAIGTSAFRDSLNADNLINEILKKAQIKIQVIDGNTEAELIAKGIFWGWNDKREKSLIVDIGGGSNECIITDEQENILWKKSYPLGMARILGKYPHSDPIKHYELNFYEDLFYGEMTDAWAAVQTLKPTVILGASGVFDTIHDMFEPQSMIKNANQNYRIKHYDFTKLYQKVVYSTMIERESMKGLIAMRRDMIVLSLIFVNTVFKYTKIDNLICCKGSLKEGIIRDVYDGKWQ